LRLFGLEAKWAGAIAYVVFSSMGRATKREYRLVTSELPAVSTLPTVPVESIAPIIDMKRFREDLARQT
jgi:hypothetical protein